jgi:tRNA pseudouridine55 synthase
VNPKTNPDAVVTASLEPDRRPPESPPTLLPTAAPIFRRSQFPEDLSAAVLPIDKPPGWTSFDVIRKLRGVLQVRKIGHAGTLDPMATGLLICLIGKATKQMEAFMHLPKVYEGAIRLGEVTPSYDAETEVSHRTEAGHLTDAQIEEACAGFVGEIDQIPPMFSAIKVQGERLYKKARRGETIARKARRVTLYGFEVLGREKSDVRFRVACSKGTYIRSLAHDLGEKLEVGGHLIALRRTAIGALTVDEAWTFESLNRAAAAFREE